MTYDNIRYTSYCWVIGTTSFRTAQLNLKIEQQLRLLRDFSRQQNAWSWNNETQEKFYVYMKDRGFLTGEAPNRAKDARQKTSGLVNLGLTNDDRQITDAGASLLQIFETQDFSRDNILSIPKDSYFYLRQLLKTSLTVDGRTVRPMVVFAHLLNNFGYLTEDEFQYLLPLVMDAESLQIVENGIRELRDEESDQTFDDIIYGTLLSMDNYQTARDRFLGENVTEALVVNIGMNRKSRDYDKPYYSLFKQLENVFVDGNTTGADIERLLNAINGTKIKTIWRTLIFKPGTTLRSTRNKGFETIKDDCPFKGCENIDALKELFFQYLHLNKAKVMLRDYFDLNRRYFKLTDTVIFEDRTVRFDTVPQAFFSLVGDALKGEMFEPNNDLTKDAPLAEISPIFSVSPNDVLTALSEQLGLDLSSQDDVDTVIRNQRQERLQELLRTRFTDDVLSELLDCFKSRQNDSRIEELVTNEATISTIFEYVLALTWYRLSENTGDVLDAMKLQLEADLMPRSHAIGGAADIIYEYDNKEPFYPAHSLVLEATLASRTNQRRMEMEPVPRHLASQRMESQNAADYCIFVAPHLDLNTVNDFRSRKNIGYYASDGSVLESLKIIPLSTDQVKYLLNSGKTYKDLYREFDALYTSATNRADTWLQEIEGALEGV